MKSLYALGRYDRIHLLCRRDRRFLREELAVCVEDHIIGCQVNGAAASPGRHTAANLMSSPSHASTDIAETTTKPLLAGAGSARLSIRGESASKLEQVAPAIPADDSELVGRASTVPRRNTIGALDCNVANISADAGPQFNSDQYESKASNRHDEGSVGALVQSAESISYKSAVQTNEKNRGLALRELLDSPRYWYDSRIVSRRDSTPRDPLVCSKLLPHFGSSDHC